MFHGSRPRHLPVELWLSETSCRAIVKTSLRLNDEGRAQKRPAPVFLLCVFSGFCVDRRRDAIPQTLVPSPYAQPLVFPQLLHL